MPRLVRLAASFFVTATILVFLLKKRASQLQIKMDSGEASEIINNEQNMIVLGSVIAGVLILSGFVMLTWTVIKHNQKQQDRK